MLENEDYKIYSDGRIKNIKTGNYEPYYENGKGYLKYGKFKKYIH